MYINQINGFENLKVLVLNTVVNLKTLEYIQQPTTKHDRKFKYTFLIKNYL